MIGGGGGGLLLSVPCVVVCVVLGGGGERRGRGRHSPRNVFADGVPGLARNFSLAGVPRITRMRRDNF